MLWDISGDLGSGKTIKSVYWSYLERLMNPKTPIFSNFKINLPKAKIIKPDELIRMKYEHALIVIDEAYVWLESRISSSLINRYMSYILFQSRKRGLNMILTEQLPITIDVRFRKLCELEIEAENKEDYFSYDYYPRKLTPTTFTLDKGFCEEYLFDKYETLEIVEPFNLEEVSNQITMITNPKKANEIINDIVANIKGLENITHAVVSDYLLQNELSQSLEPYVYARLKARQQKRKKSNN